MEEPFSFLADVHLGKLAKSLRMLGFNTTYKNDFTNDELIELAKAERKILLSRNEAFGKCFSSTFCFIESEQPLEQIRQVVRKYNLQGCFHPFSRCMLCNENLESREKKTISHLLEENTKQVYNDFWQCTSCHKIYWKGSHFDRMEKMIKQLGLKTG